MCFGKILFRHVGRIPPLANVPEQGIVRPLLRENTKRSIDGLKHERFVNWFAADLEGLSKHKRWLISVSRPEHMIPGHINGPLRPRRCQSTGLREPLRRLNLAKDWYLESLIRCTWRVI
jgi:hypothetical protein